ncbi:hypothetical protein [Myroides odoratimimus]|uniref:hypothetical protein n=1 Tax=Myroides odoratimimus TaxID=76832 RepID=UPI0025767C74|nr:hypothetical protein [Myroides odoratimimus]MDM1499099.1 hypothetical protein [Myroides odoratimimus]
MNKVFVVFFCVILLYSCGNKGKVNQEIKTSSFDFKDSLIEFEKIYLLSNIYDVDKDTIVNILSEYHNEVPFFSTEDNFDYNEVIAKLSLKYNVDSKTISRIILEYNFVGI